MGFLAQIRAKIGWDFGSQAEKSRGCYRSVVVERAAHQFYNILVFWHELVAEDYFFVDIIHSFMVITIRSAFS